MTQRSCRTIALLPPLASLQTTQEGVRGLPVQGFKRATAVCPGTPVLIGQNKEHASELWNHEQRVFRN